MRPRAKAIGRGITRSASIPIDCGHCCWMGTILTARSPAARAHRDHPGQPDPAPATSGGQPLTSRATRRDPAARDRPARDGSRAQGQPRSTAHQSSTTCARRSRGSASAPADSSVAPCGPRNGQPRRRRQPGRAVTAVRRRRLLASCDRTGWGSTGVFHGREQYCPGATVPYVNPPFCKEQTP